VHAPHYVAICGLFRELQDFRKMLFLFSLQLVFEAFLILRRNERDIIINILASSCKGPVIRVRF